MLLSDRSVLLVDNERVGRISPDGDVTQLCELPLNERGSVVGLIRGNLMVAYHRSVSAFTIPGAPELAASGWVMRGGGPAQGWAPVSRSAAEFFPFPAGVFDPHTQVAYVPTDGGATQALALADGAQRWRTPSPARPVAIWHGRVIVLRPAASALEFAELDPANGALLATSQPIPLPAWVPRDMAPWGDPLVTTVQVEGDRARLDWEAFINGGSGGAQIPPHGATGRSEVDLASGAVSLSPTQMVEGARPIPNPKGPLAVVLGGRRFTLTYLATGTLTATDARSGKKLWTKTLWSIAPRVPILAP